MALKRCNNRREQELWWGVFTPAAWRASRRSSFQTRLATPVPGGLSPTPAVALRDVLSVSVLLSPSLYLCLSTGRAICTPCIRMTVWLTQFLFESSSSGNDSGQLSEFFFCLFFTLESQCHFITRKRQCDKTVCTLDVKFEIKLPLSCPNCVLKHSWGNYQFSFKIYIRKKKEKLLFSNESVADNWSLS